MFLPVLSAKKQQNGFSLMELFCVLAIIAIMLAASVIYFSSFSHNQAISEAMSQVEIIVHVAETQFKLHGSYENVSTQVVQKTHLMPPKYNFIFQSADNLKVLGVPWTDQAGNRPGIGVSSTPPYNNYTVTFTYVPAWACSTLLSQMRLISQVTSQVTCDIKGGSVQQMHFILPKVDDDINN